jgi:hypothetical protein
MRELLGRFLRLAALTASGLILAAVLLGHRYCPTRDVPHDEIRSPAVPRYHGLSDFGLARDRVLPRVLDAETGAASRCTIADPRLLGLLGCSPWRDAAGRYHLVARAIDAVADPRGFPAGEIILIRCTYPSGRVLGRVVLDRMPIGPVCWSPDRGDRILFASGDGRLYRHEFPPEEWPGTVAASPRPIRWGCGPPGADGVFLQDPCWPGGPYPGGWLLAAVRVRQGDPRPLTDLRLWWLKLDAGEGAIVEARRAIGPEGEGSAADGDEEYSPVVGVASGGFRNLAYLVRRQGQSGLELRVAPLAAGASDEGPQAVPPGRKVTDGCLAMAPSFSSDGRWVHAAMPDERDTVRIERLAAFPTEYDGSLPRTGE